MKCRTIVAGCSLLLMVAACATQDGPYSIRGTGRLPSSCAEAPALLLDGTWFDAGTVEVTSAGCDDARPGERYTTCGLQWVMTQQDNDVEIVVDNEYRIQGRMCGKQLHLDGGWWLAVQDESGYCTYEEEDASEVLIQSDGNTLTLTEPTSESTSRPTLVGTLSLGGNCTGQYTITLAKTS